jgi:shikimate 5-dehydrogenase
VSFLSLLTGCFSTPAAENPTVAMVEAAYRHHGLDARYVNCDVAPDALGDAVRGARAMGGSASTARSRTRSPCSSTSTVSASLRP